MKNPKGNMQNAMTLLKWQEEGKLKPHIHKVYELKDTSKALQAMLDREVMGKLVVKI